MAFLWVPAADGCRELPAFKCGARVGRRLGASVDAKSDRPAVKRSEDEARAGEI